MVVVVGGAVVVVTGGSVVVVGGVVVVVGGTVVGGTVSSVVVSHGHVVTFPAASVRLHTPDTRASAVPSTSSCAITGTTPRTATATAAATHLETPLAFTYYSLRWDGPPARTLGSKRAGRQLLRPYEDGEVPVKSHGM